MLIRYASRHRWIKTIHPDILPDFGKNGSKKITRLLNRAAERNISYIFAPLEESFFTWFKPLYDNQVAVKNNFSERDIIANTLYNRTSKYPCYSLTILENDLPVGGAIFSLRPNRLSIIYRVFMSSWRESLDLRCSPALFAEYLLSQHALQHNLPNLVHGRDKNPYGINAAIGLAAFKLSVGCHPELQKTHDVHEFDTEGDYTVDTLVLKLPDDSRVIKEAYLITTENNFPKYDQLMKYEKLLKINTVLLIETPEIPLSVTTQNYF